jgi:predicted nucleotidyltransferase
MKAVGLVVEYNPFHNGHAHHLAAAKAQSEAEVVIAVMSGNFLQRGEPALVSKWQRTKMALHGGVDIVLELPYIFATQKAETFADGAISILDAIGCGSLCFGSENGEIAAFYKTLEFMENSQESYQANIRKYIKTGVSYPKAQSLSFAELNQSEDLVDLSKPNNILGYHYLKAIISQKSLMRPFTVKRKNADYHDEHFSSERIASATSIRKALFSSVQQEAPIDQFVPAQTNYLLTDYYKQYGIFHQWENYYPYLQFLLLQTKPNELRDIYEVEEGIENRLIKAALTSNCFQEFMENVKTKRYTWTRIQRICLHILTNTKKSQMDLEKPTYIRLLGMTESGKHYLNKMKAHLGLPLVSKLSSYKHEDIFPDIKAARVYSCVLPGDRKVKSFHQEYKQPPIYIRKAEAPV